MSTQQKILAFSGSARADSHNQRLVHIAGTGAKEAGAEVTVINLGDFDLPLFNEDLEKDGQPANVKKLKQLFIEHDGLLISSPEYNSSVTPLLKNAIDWVSRGDEGEPPLAAYNGKVAGLMATSPGGLGGPRGLVHLRAILGNIGVIVLPKQMAIGQAFQAFGDDGNLVDEKQQASILEIGRTVAETSARLKSE
jgi:NAD(P)H-dependent FMN reductase